MLKQLLLCKRLFNEGMTFAKRSDSVSNGIAISLFQDSVEICVWAIIKDKNIQVKDGAPFTGYIEAIQKAGLILPQVAKINELNKARVNFKHYGNLPASDEGIKFQSYVEDFLTTSFQDYFNQDFEKVSLVDLVSDPNVREKLKEAESLMLESNFNEAAARVAIAKTMLFARLDRFIPKVAPHLRDMDSVMDKIPELRGARSRTFQYLTEYLGNLREITVASLLQLPFQDYMFLTEKLPSAYQLGDGSWQTNSKSLSSPYDNNTCQRAIDCLVNIATRLENII